MEMNEDQLLKDFFKEQKKEIPDNQFAEKVIRKLPNKQHRLHWLVPFAALAGLFVTYCVVDVTKVISDLFFLLLQVPILYLGILSFSIPFICLIVWYFREKEMQLGKY
jgi:hypothetical protein